MFFFRIVINVVAATASFQVEAVDEKLDIHIIFHQTAFKIIEFLHHIENIIRSQVLLGGQQTRIGNINLESVDVTVVF